MWKLFIEPEYLYLVDPIENIIRVEISNNLNGIRILKMIWWDVISKEDRENLELIE